MNKAYLVLLGLVILVGCTGITGESIKEDCPACDSCCPQDTTPYTSCDSCCSACEPEILYKYVCINRSIVYNESDCYSIFNLNRAKIDIPSLLVDGYSIKSVNKIIYSDGLFEIEISYGNWVMRILKEGMFTTLKELTNYLNTKDIDVQNIKIVFITPMGGVLRGITTWNTALDILALNIGYEDWTAIAIFESKDISV